MDIAESYGMTALLSMLKDYMDVFDDERLAKMAVDGELKTSVEAGEVDEVIHMLDIEGANINALHESEFGDEAPHGLRTALAIASERGYVEVVKVLLRRNAAPNVCDQNTRITPMILAAFNSNFKCLEQLMTCGADPKIPSKVIKIMIIISHLYQFFYHLCVGWVNCGIHFIKEQNWI